MAHILVYALHYDGAINKNSLGAVSEGAKLAAELGGEAHAILLGENVPRELAASLGKYGASKVLVAEGPEGLAQPLVDAMARAISDGGYSYALFGGGLLGFEIGARLNAFEIRESGGADAPVEDLSFELSGHASQATMLTRGEQRGADVDIEGADILVAGGRGLGKAEGFELAEDLAKAFGGNSAVAATRAVVDAGWYPYAAQIGQTGKTVAPKLYLAAGISGAIQHKVGMQASENIVAINKDANAPIFEFSDLGIVGDLNKILPKLTEAVKARKG